MERSDLIDIDGPQEELINTTRTLLFHNNPELFELLDFENEDIFLEPLLFSYFTVNPPDAKLEQILFGYLSEDKRPNSIEVSTNRKGVIYLPNYGYIKTPYPDSEFSLSWNIDTGISIWEGKKSIPYRFSPITYIEGTKFEVLRESTSLVDWVFTNEDGKIDQVNIEETANKHLQSLTMALKILEENFPEYYNLISETTRKFVLFNHHLHRSCATIQAQGIAFLNVKDDFDEVAILEDIAHQCAHVIFLSFLREPSEYVKYDLGLAMKDFTHEEKEYRTIADGVHALYTYYNILPCADKCLDNNVFSGKQLYEHIGRFVYDIYKFGSDIKTFDKVPHLFTAKGLELYRNFRTVYFNIVEKRKDLVEKYKVENNGFSFDYQTFVSINQIHTV